MRSTQHEAARRYVLAGWPVFPLLPDDGTEDTGKKPRFKGSFHAAFTTIEQVDQHWTAYPDDNIGMEPGAAGLLVADLDGLDGAAAWAELPEEMRPATHTVRTWSGGRHLYYEGRGPCSVRKIIKGRGIDTRGDGGYVVLPPSRVAGKPYEVVDAAEIAALPGWIGDRLLRSDLAIAAPPQQIDDGAAYSRGKRLIADRISRGEVAVIGPGANDRTYRLACELRDLGLGESAAFELMQEMFHCAPPWDQALSKCAANAYRFALNEAGSDAVEPSAQVFGAAIALQESQEQDKVNAMTARFMGRKPSEGAALPDLVFWDHESTYLRSPQGSVTVAYGPSGGHKTTMVLRDMLDACIDRGARVLYCAGEGSHGIERYRIPAACKARGVAVATLDADWRTAAIVPLLTSNEMVDGLLAAAKALKPDFIVLDTFAAASGGLDENSSTFGAMLTSTGPVGRVARETAANVVVIHHSGKDLGKGTRGHSSITGNADAVFRVTSDKDARTLDKYVEKMRDAQDNFTISYGLSPAAEVPVATRGGRTAGKPKAPVEVDEGRQHLGQLLLEHGIIGSENGLTSRELADLWCGPRPLDGDSSLAEWLTQVAARKKWLENGRRTVGPHGQIAARLAGYFQATLRPGAREPVALWFLPS